MSAAALALLVAAVMVWPVTGPSHTGGGSAREPRPITEPEAGAEVVAEAVDPGRVAIAMDLLALALRSGAGVPETLDEVAAELDPVVGGQLRVVSAGLRWGLDEVTAWGSLPRVWDPAARAMTMAGVAGVPPAELLTAAAAELRRADEARLEVAAARLGVRLVLPLGLAFLPAFVLLSVLPIVLGLAGQLLSP